jgi:hypothetical protein
MNKIYVLICFILLFSSCPTPYTPQKESGLPEDDTPISLAEDLFAETGFDEYDRKITSFLLNDNTYWNENGCTLWSLKDEAEEEPFTTRKVILSKITGSNIAGYGLVICQKLRPGYGQTMLTIMINTEQNYAIGKVIGGNYHSLKSWTYSKYLEKGYGRPNELKITYDKTAKEYTLLINNNEVEKFKDETEPVHENGKNGYIAVISPQDKFPQNPVEIIFLE